MNPESSIYFYIYVCMLVYTKENKNQKEKKSNIGRQETTIKHEGKYIYTNISNIVIIIIYFCVSLHIIYTYIYIFSVNINIAYTSLSLSLFYYFYFVAFKGPAQTLLNNRFFFLFCLSNCRLHKRTMISSEVR